MAKRNTGSIRQVRPGVHRVTIDLSNLRMPTLADWHAANQSSPAVADHRGHPRGCGAQAPRDAVRGRQRQADGGLDPRPVAGFLA